MILDTDEAFRRYSKKRGIPLDKMSPKDIEIAFLEETIRLGQEQKKLLAGIPGRVEALEQEVKALIEALGKE